MKPRAPFARAAVMVLWLSAFSVLPASVAVASSIELSPTTITLAGGSPTELVTVRNLGAEAVRLELSVFAWSEKPAGESLLSATDEILFFPELLTVAPGGESKIRVGTTAPPASVEKTYRLILQELPGFKTSSRTLKVQVLIGQSVPIFVEPAQATTNGQVETMSVGHGTLSFTVRNTGTRHFIARKIRMTGFDVAGKQLFTHTTVGWYILAGGSCHYELPIHPGTCDLRVEVETGEQTLNRDFNPHSDSCSARSEQGLSRPAKVASVSPAAAPPAR